MIKVASYCRVSTDKEDQVNSFEAQQRYFREYIGHRPDWELYEIYADEGITGTSIKKRTQFIRMIDDAYEGKFQLIVTKEVSRFSRNILDTISYARELKAIGIGIQFMIDGINTLRPDAELYLSIMASMAQEESRKTSNRVIWGQTRQMEKGVVFGRSLLGYDVKDGRISVNSEGAEIVRLIFEKYAMEQVSTSEIARFLTQNGYHTSRGSTKWQSNTIVKILTNEKYTGNLIQKKTYTPDFLNHEKKRNNGAVPLIRIENHHEAIISKEIWSMAQARLHRNNKHTAGNQGHSNRYLFSGKIKCGECGASFVSRIKYLKDGIKMRRWSCRTATQEGTASCNIGKLIRDDDARYMLKTVIQSLQIDRCVIASHMTKLILTTIHNCDDMYRENSCQLQLEIDRIQMKKETALDRFFSGDISKEEKQTMVHLYESQINCLRNKLLSDEKHKNTSKDPASMEKRIYQALFSILNGEEESDVFYKTMLHSLTVFKDRHIELRLNHLTQVFFFLEC